MDDLTERPFGMALVAGWFAVGGIAMVALLPSMWRALQLIESNLGETIIGIILVVEVVIAIALFGIAAALWRDPARVRLLACAALAVSGIGMVWKGATPVYYGVAAVNLIALVYLTWRVRGTGSRSGRR